MAVPFLYFSACCVCVGFNINIPWNLHRRSTFLAYQHCVLIDGANLRIQHSWHYLFSIIKNIYWRRLIPKIAVVMVGKKKRFFPERQFLDHRSVISQGHSDGLSYDNMCQNIMIFLWRVLARFLILQATRAKSHIHDIILYCREHREMS